MEAAGESSAMEPKAKVSFLHARESPNVVSNYKEGKVKESYRVVLVILGQQQLCRTWPVDKARFYVQELEYIIN